MKICNKIQANKFTQYECFIINFQENTNIKINVA